MFKNPTYKIENQLYKRGFQSIAGLDEAGRGAWAGPVVAAAVILPPKLKIKGLRDSKLLPPQKRQELYIYINKNALAIGFGVISEKIIDTEGIIPATRQAFLKAIDDLKERAEYLLVDGTRIFSHSLPLDFHIKGDQKIVSIAVASVMAKVMRDSLLNQYHQEFPEYGFDAHKGYGTRAHRQAILTHGPCRIHRLSFRPLVEL